jgi:hypothetical protein
MPETHTMIKQISFTSAALFVAFLAVSGTPARQIELTGYEFKGVKSGMDHWLQKENAAWIIVKGVDVTTREPYERTIPVRCSSILKETEEPYAPSLHIHGEIIIALHDNPKRTIRFSETDALRKTSERTLNNLQQQATRPCQETPLFPQTIHAF